MEKKLTETGFCHFNFYDHRQKDLYITTDSLEKLFIMLLLKNCSGLIPTQIITSMSFAKWFKPEKPKYF